MWMEWSRESDEVEAPGADFTSGRMPAQAERMSPPLPGLLVIAFPQVLVDAEQKKLSRALLAMCQSPAGGPVCQEMRIQQFEAVSPSLLSSTEKRYEKP